MIPHSMIFDDFFTDPNQVKKLINAEPMRDEKYDDGVIYPNITRLPEAVLAEIQYKLMSFFGPSIDLVLAFARYSFENVTPPHWAHSDRNIAQYVGLIYMNENHSEFGTATLRHAELGFEKHPQTEFHKRILLSHANARQEWEITYKCPAKFNRLFVLNADLIHAALGEYGTTKEDGRLVVSVFFNAGKHED